MTLNRQSRRKHPTTRHLPPFFAFLCQVIPLPFPFLTPR